MKKLWVLLLFLCGFSGIAFSEGNWIKCKTDVSDEYITNLAIEGEYVWAGTTAFGLIKWNRISNTFQRYTTKDGLSSDGVSAIAIDNNGIKWLGQGWTSRIASFDNTVFNTYTKENLPQINFGFSIDDIVVEPDNTVLFSASGASGTQGASGLFIYQNDTWKIKTIPGNAGSPFQLAVDTVNPDTVWYGKNGPGVGYFVKPNYNLETDNRFASISGKVISMDITNTIWYAGYSDIYKFDRQSIIHFPPDSTGLLANICAIAVDKNNVKWFGSSMGITSYNGNSWQTYAPDGWYYHYDAAFSGYTDQVTSLAFDDDGILWVGTNKGLYRFEKSPVSVQDAAPKPVSVSIDGISPNPFNASSVITFSLPNPDMATLTVYSLTGQKVRTLVSERLSAGKHSASWDGRDERGGAVSSGVFIATLQSGGKTDSRKMMLLK